MYNRLYEYVIGNELVSSNQSGFRFTITPDTYQSFDNDFEARCAFLDISNTFEKVWHNVLVYKLKQNGVAGNFLNTLTNFLKD